MGDPAFPTVPGPNPLSARPPLPPRRALSGYASAPFTWDFVSHPLTFLSDSFFKMQCHLLQEASLDCLPLCSSSLGCRHSPSSPSAMPSGSRVG